MHLAGYMLAMKIENEINRKHWLKNRRFIHGYSTWILNRRLLTQKKRLIKFASLIQEKLPA